MLDDGQRLRLEDASFSGLGDERFHRLRVQLGEILSLYHSRHVIQGELEAELLQLLEKSTQSSHARTLV